MKIVKEENAEKFNYANTSSVLEYGIALNERNMGFCTNKITGRYSMQGYYSKLECEELWYILEETIHKRNSEPIEFNRCDIIFINKKY